MEKSKTTETKAEMRHRLEAAAKAMEKGENVVTITLSEFQAFSEQLKRRFRPKSKP
jgi:hypothetical protein